MECASRKGIEGAQHPDEILPGKPTSHVTNKRTLLHQKKRPVDPVVGKTMIKGCAPYLVITLDNARAGVFKVQQSFLE